MPMHLLKLSDGSRMEGDVGFLPSTPQKPSTTGPMRADPRAAVRTLPVHHDPLEAPSNGLLGIAP